MFPARPADDVRYAAYLERGKNSANAARASQHYIAADQVLNKLVERLGGKKARRYVIRETRTVFRFTADAEVDLIDCFGSDVQALAVEHAIPTLRNACKPMRMVPHKTVSPLYELVVSGAGVVMLLRYEPPTHATIIAVRQHTDADYAGFSNDCPWKR